MPDQISTAKRFPLPQLRRQDTAQANQDAGVRSVVHACVDGGGQKQREASADKRPLALV